MQYPLNLLKRSGAVKRFLMNVMLASGGYPWTVIPVQERNAYMGALEKASVDGDITPLVWFIADLVKESLNGTYRFFADIEGNTLKEIVEKMRKKFSVRRFIFIADRELFSAKNMGNTLWRGSLHCYLVKIQG